MGMCVVKQIGVKFPTEQEFENSFRYAKRMDMAFAKNGLIQIVKDIIDYKEFCDVKKDYDITENDAVIMRFSTYNEVNEKTICSPMVISDDIEEIYSSQDDILKSVIAFHKEPAMNNEIKNKTAFFIKMLSKFDYKNNQKLFNLAIGDNKACILESDGNISVWSSAKTRNWESSNGVLFSDTDYKTVYNSYYYNNYDNYDDYEGYYGRNVYNQNYNSIKYCCMCQVRLSSAILSDGKYYCQRCYQKKRSYMTCDVCGAKCNSVYVVEGQNQCARCHRKKFKCVVCGEEKDYKEKSFNYSNMCKQCNK